MQTKQLFINGQSLDLDDDAPIASTFQINNLADVQNQNGNITNQFKVPLTQKNRIILGFPDDISLCGLQPYRQLPAKYVQDGIEIIPAGVCEIQDAPDNYCNLLIVSGNCGFFDAIGGQIYDMSDSLSVWTDYGKTLVWKPYDHIWNLANAAGSQQKTEGWIYPVVDYGAIDKTDFTQPINVQQQRPGFFLHTAIELLVKAAGYRIDTVRSKILQDPLYKQLIIQFANSSFEHGTDYQNTPDNLSMTTTKADTQTMQHPAASGFITFNQLYYVATKRVNGTASVTFDITIVGLKSSTLTAINIDINVQDRTAGTNINIATQSYSLDDRAILIAGSGFGAVYQQTFLKQKISCDLQLVPNMAININYSMDNSQAITGYFAAGAIFSFISDESQVLFEQMVQCERILPDVSQTDLLKDTLQHFGIVCQTNTVTKEVIFATFADIVKNIPLALDWSLKCVDMGKQVNFTLGNYSQINWMRYQFDDSVPIQSMVKYFADDHIDIDNQNINPNTPQSDLFQSIFAPSINQSYYGGSIAQILKIDTVSSPTAFAIGTQPRLLVDQKLNIGQIGKTVTFSDGDPGLSTTNTIVISDIISVPYFYKSDGLFNLCWCDKGGQPGLRSRYYKELEHILKETKKVTRYFLLTPLDIAQLDLLVPIYLRMDNAYFYINKIENWIKGQPVKVELVRL